MDNKKLTNGDLKASATEALRDVIDSAKLAAEAVEKSRQAQLDLTEDGVRNIMVEVLQDVFGEHASTGRFVDVARIPLICQNIIGMSERVNKIDDNINWIVRLIIGAVVLGIIALLFKM